MNSGHQEQNNKSMQQSSVPDQLYGQMDAMELTPSAASMSSSHKRNRSQYMAGEQAHEGNGGQMKFTVNHFNGAGNGAKPDPGPEGPSQTSEPQVVGSFPNQGGDPNQQEVGNDTIVNPAIQRGHVSFNAAAEGQAEDQNRRGLRHPADENQPMIRETNDLQILEHYEYQQEGPLQRSQQMNIQEGGGLSQKSGSARATISLTQLQAQAEQQPFLASGKQSTLQSSHQTPHMSNRERQALSGPRGSDGPPAADGVAYGQGGTAQPNNFEQLNFNQIDQEEQLLDEQYRQLSQNQRAPYRLPVSRETVSATTSQRQRTAPNLMQHSMEPSSQSNRQAHFQVDTNRRGHSRQSRSNSSEQVMSQRQQQSFGQMPIGGPVEHQKARSLVVSGKHPARNSRNNGHDTGPPSQQQVVNGSSHAGSNSQGAAHAQSLSQQSLLNRNTSPFNRRHSNNSASEQMISASNPSGVGTNTMQHMSGDEGQADSQAAASSSRGRLGSGPNQVYPQGPRDANFAMNSSRAGGTADSNQGPAQEQQRSVSNNSNMSRKESAANSAIRTEENYRRLQLKIRDQAKRLLELKNQLKQANQKVNQLSEAQSQQVGTSQLANSQIQRDAAPPRQTGPQETLGARDTTQAEMIEDLQQRNLEIAKGLINQTELQRRLQQAESNLRRETALNEEQRAQIVILKQGIEHNLEKIGLRFSHHQNSQYANQRGPLSQIDGYLQLMRFAQQNEEQKTKIQYLEDQLLRFNDKAEAALKVQESQKNEEISFVNKDYKKQLDAKQSLIDVLTAEKKAMQSDKDQLLDYVEKSEAKEREQGLAMQRQADENGRLKSEKEALEGTRAQMEKEKKDQDELLRQVKDNLRDMRTERESLANEVTDLKHRQEQLNLRLDSKTELLNRQKQENDKLKDLLREYQEQKGALEMETGLKLESKDEELRRLRSQMVEYQNSIEQKEALIEKQRSQIQTQKSKIAALEQSKDSLKRTLKDSQQELTNLVDIHEKLTAQQSLKTQDALHMSAEINQLKTDVLKKKQVINQYQRRLEQKDVEMSKFHEKLAEKNKEHLDNERTFIKDLKKREEEAQEIQRKLQDLQAQLADRSIKIDYLEKLRNDQKSQELHLKKSIEAKERAYEELGKELRTNKSLFERQQHLLETTLNNELQHKDQKEHLLNAQIEKLTAETTELRQQREDIQLKFHQVERQLAECKEQARKFEATEYSQGPDQSRWNLDLTRMDNELCQEQEKSRRLQRDNEKLKAERTGDTMMLSKYREFDEQLLRIQNQLVGQMSKFANQISKVEDLEAKYPHLYRLTNAQMNFKENATSQDKDYICGNLEKLQEWILLIQKQMKDTILQSEKEKEMKNKQEAAAEETSFDFQLDLIQRDKIPERDMSLRKKDEGRPEHMTSINPNVDQLHHLDKLQEVEAQVHIERDIKNYLEQCLAKISQLLRLDSQFRQTLLEFLAQTKSLYQFRMESKMIGSKLRHQEMRYTSLLQEKQQNRSIYKNELVHLKQNIEKDRLQLSHLDRKVEQVEASLSRAMQELVRLDQSNSLIGQSNQMRVNQLTDQLLEMKKNYNDVSQKKEWAEAKLQEIQTQRNLFDQNELGHQNSLVTQMSHRRNSRRNSSKLQGSLPTEKRSAEQATEPEGPMPPRPIYALRNSRSRLAAQRMSQQHPATENQKIDMEFNKIPICQTPNEQNNLPRISLRSPQREETPDMALQSKITSQALDAPGDSNRYQSSTDQLLPNDKQREQITELQQAINYQNHNLTRSDHKKMPSIGASGTDTALGARLDHEMRERKVQTMLGTSSDRHQTGSFTAHQILSSSAAGRIHEKNAGPAQNTTHARIPTEVSVKNILMERLHGESSQVHSASPQHEVADMKLDYAGDASPGRHLRTLEGSRRPRHESDWIGQPNAAYQQRTVGQLEASDKSPNRYKRENGNESMASYGAQSKPYLEGGEQLFSPQYKVSVDLPARSTPQDQGSQPRGSYNRRQEHVSDALGGQSPSANRNPPSGRRDRSGQYRTRQADAHLDRLNEEARRRTSSSPQDGVLSKEQQSRKQPEATQLRAIAEVSRSEAPRDEFQLLTKGNHLLPLQQQPGSQQSYVNTYGSSPGYVDTVQQSRPYVDTSAHDTRHSGAQRDFKASQFGSFVRTDEAQTNLRESQPRPGGENLVGNQFDFIDQQRLERALTPQRSQGGHPSTYSPDRVGHGPGTKAQRADSGSKDPESRREQHFIASNSLRKEKKETGEYRTRSPTYHALRHQARPSEVSQPDSLLQSQPRPYNTTTQKQQF